MIELPFPANALWPNSRHNRYEHARQVKKHREWARLATLADATRPATVGGLVATFYPKATGRMFDRDNATAALKAYQDGVADAYRVDDGTFDQPRVLIGERTKHGKVVIALEPKEV